MKPRSDGLTLISLYHFICGFVSLMVMCGLITVPFIVGLSTAAANDPDGATATAITGIVMLVIGAFFLVIAMANLLVGWGIWQRREWARLGGLALSIFRLINIPLGTVIGGLIIWYLLREDVMVEFAG
ncbi:MAG: hypothetical protein AUK03_10245 [Anaerolineae bacterium CG2_30_64_16]|nr:MAG: hypothetical protein AUK03_10245 [Anaerolineae bacterium CG2_30_64_16]